MESYPTKLEKKGRQSNQLVTWWHSWWSCRVRLGPGSFLELPHTGEGIKFHHKTIVKLYLYIYTLYSYELQWAKVPLQQIYNWISTTWKIPNKPKHNEAFPIKISGRLRGRSGGHSMFWKAGMMGYQLLKYSRLLPGWWIFSGKKIYIYIFFVYIILYHMITWGWVNADQHSWTLSVTIFPCFGGSSHQAAANVTRFFWLRFFHIQVSSVQNPG